MFLSMNWVRDFVDLSGLNLEELIHQFTLSTAEVEGIEYAGRDIDGVVVGQILSMEDHPNSKKLHLLQVDGGDRVYQVVCGAPNVKVGIKVPFVKIGGKAGGMQIEKRPIAGYDSEGMCCSEREIGISDNHEGLMILPDDAPVGKDIKELYEIEDVIFEVDNKSLTNRPDLWGHYGIAREIAALAGRPLKPYAKEDLAIYQSLPEVPIEVKNTDLVYRYSAMAFRNITVAKAPTNMRIRLYRCGMRAINLLADLTNYIMLELGQPMHAFDYKRVRQIEVGTYPEPFTFATLDGKERTIGTDTLMISSQGVPVGVAGIMGGLASEIVSDTNSFLLESATFDAVSIRKSSVALGLRTDASMRYEKTLDPEMTVDAIGRYLYLLKSIDPAAEVISCLSDHYVKHFPVRTIEFDKAYVDRVTGIDIAWPQIVSTLRSLGFTVDDQNGAAKVTVPSWRATKDVTIKADIIEEITRIYGYDNFEIKTATCAIKPQAYSEHHVLTEGCKDLLAFSFGAHEVHTYVWNDGKKLEELGLPSEGYLKLTNSLSPDISTIRSEMVPALLCVVARNKGYKPEFTVFEIGSTVRGLKEDGLADEHKCLGIVLWGRKSEESRLFFEARRMVESMAQVLRNTQFTFAKKEETRAWQHPYNAFTIQDGETVLGEMAVVHPSVSGRIDKKGTAIAIEIDMDAFCGVATEPVDYDEPSRYPEVVNDLSFQVAEDMNYETLADTIDAVASPMLVSYSLVGIYRDPSWKDQKSVTIRFVFGSKERTLSGDEVQACVDELIGTMKKIGAIVKL
jgi:phenylalanyl-tRNA synthetase beta chain